MSPELREAYSTYESLAHRVVDLTLKKALELKNRGFGVRMPEGSSWGKSLTFHSPITIIPLKRKIEVGPELEIQAVIVLDKKCIIAFSDPDVEMDGRNLKLLDHIELLAELERILEEK